MAVYVPMFKFAIRPHIKVGHLTSTTSLYIEPWRETGTDDENLPGNVPTRFISFIYA